MFTEILKIIPRLEGRDLNRLENSLNGRFQKVAKKFGSGLLSAIKGGGVIGLATALIDKILNPLKEVQDSIEKSLQSADQLTTNAGQFGTTSGKLARLQAFGKAKGLDPESLNVLITKFQGAVAEARKDPSTITAVSKYTGITDTAEGFFEFIQALQKMTKTQQTLVQQEVFGEKQILKMSEFLQTDFHELAKNMGGPSAEQLTFDLEKLGKLEDFQSSWRAARDLGDIHSKAGGIGIKEVMGINEGEDFALNRENQRLKSAANLKSIEKMQSRLAAMVEDLYLSGGVTGVLKTVNKFDALVDLFKSKSIMDAITTDLSKVGNSRAARGVTPAKDK